MLIIKVKVDLEGQGQLPTPPPLPKNRDLNQGALHHWSKFGDPKLNGWRVMVRTSLNGVNLDF